MQPAPDADEKQNLSDAEQDKAGLEDDEEDEVLDNAEDKVHRIAMTTISKSFHRMMPPKTFEGDILPQDKLLKMIMACEQAIYSKWLADPVPAGLRFPWDTSNLTAIHAEWNKPAKR